MFHSIRPLRVLHIEDEESEAQLVRAELRKVTSRLHLRRVCEEKEFLDALKGESWDFVLCNFHAGCLPAWETLRHVKTIHGDLPFILISGPVGEETVASLMKEGADDFILKGNYFRIVAVVKRILMDQDIRMKAQKAQHRAFQAFAARERMLAIVSHDIKNPLSAIHLEAQMLMRTVDKYGKSVMGEEVKIQAGRILKTTGRMKELIVDLLEKNKGGQEGLKNLQKSEVDPVSLFYESVDNVRPLIQEKNINLRFRPKEDVPKILLDRNKMYQVFSNLLSNAIKFTPSQGVIEFDLNWDADQFTFSLTDSGRGLPAGEEEKVFEKYWTGKKYPGSGTGLGLFICRSIIEAHGGAIRSENVPGKGASFIFTLPREKEIHSSYSEEDIFVIDDDEDLCEVMTWAMKKEGFQVKAFSSGESALRALEGRSPRALIVDYHLGDMDGCEFLKRKAELGNESPVILVSGSPDEVKCAAPEGEYVSIVEKPLDLEGLLREVKSLSGPYWQKSSNEASTRSSHGPASSV